MGPLDIEEKEERDLSWSDVKKGVGKGLDVIDKTFEFIDDQVGIPGTDIDVQHARDLITDPLDKMHPVAGLVGEVLVPDSTDLLGGAGFVKRGVKNIPEITRVLRQTDIMNKTLGGVSARLRGARSLFHGNPFIRNIGTGLDGKNTHKFGEYFVPPTKTQVYRATVKLLNDKVLYGAERKFNYNAFKGLYTGKNKSRQIEILMQTTPYSKIPNWETHRQGLVDVFESIYGDTMRIKGIPRDQIDIDHLVTLRSTMPIYDDIAYGGQLWKKVQERFLRKGYKPGNTLKNLEALDPGSHIVKTNFFNVKLGKDGSKFFDEKILHDGKMIKRSEYMKLSDANRMEVLDDLIEIQDEGMQVLREAQNVWETLYKIDSAEMPQSILDKLSKIEINDFSHPELRKENLDELRAIITDIVQSGAKKGRPKKIQNTLKRIFPDVDPDTGDVQGNLFD